MARRSLVFMDSGIGGIPYLKWVRQKRPHWHYVYVADNSYFPYGGRSPEDLKNRLSFLSEQMIGLYSPDMIVIACNTASVAALSALRSRFSVPFVGVVPAVKPAAENHRTGRIGVLATKGTVEGEYLKELIRKFSPDTGSVDCIAAPDLVQFVERKLPDAEEEEIRNIVLPYLEEAKKREWDHMVLGCTHYLFLKPWLEKWKSPSLTIIDSADGVGKRILSLLEEESDNFAGTEGQGVLTALFHITDDTVPLDLFKNLTRRENMDLKPLKAEGV